MDFQDCHSHFKGLTYFDIFMAIPSDICNSTLLTTGAGIDLVPSGNKTLPELMLTRISVATWRH